MTAGPPTCGTRFPQLVERAFIGDLPRWRRRSLARHLATCDSCRDRADRLAAVDRQLGGAPLSDAAIARIGRAVIADAGAAPRRRWPLWVGVGALGTTAAVLVAVSVDRRQPESLRARGDGVVMGQRSPGVRVFCVADDAGEMRVVAESRVVSGTAKAPPIRCTLDAELQLAYSTPGLEGLTMVAFGRSGQSIFYYAPRAADHDAVPLEADRVDEVLGWSTRLGVKHEVGDYELIVRIFDRPVRAEAAIHGDVAPVVELRGRLELAAGGARDPR